MNYQNATNPTSYSGGNENYAVDAVSSLQPAEYPISTEPARPISIQPLNHGYLVNIGCQSFAATDVKDMLTKIEVYLKNPLETEKLWFEKKDLTLIK